jgi:hypothetical protein
VSRLPAGPRRAAPKRTGTDHLYLLTIETGEPVTVEQDWLRYGTGERLRLVPIDALLPLSEYEVTRSRSDGGRRARRTRVGSP